MSEEKPPGEVTRAELMEAKYLTERAAHARTLLRQAEVNVGEADTALRQFGVTLRERYGLGEGDGINGNTGAITRVPTPNGKAPDA